MNSVWRQLAIATNWPVLVAVVVLSALGVLSVWADSPADGQRQLMFLVVAGACMALFQAIDYRTIGRFSWVFYIASILLLLYTVVPWTHVESGDNRLLRVPKLNGAYNWINFVFLRFQPAELTKIAFVMVMARYLRFRSNYRTLKGLLPPFALAMFPLALILKQPDLGTALIFIPALFVMLFVAGAKIRHLLAIVALGLAMGPVLWMCGPKEEGAPGLPLFKHMPAFVRDYQRKRVYAMFNDDHETLQATGYQ